MKINLFEEMLQATDDEFVQEKLKSSTFLINKICEDEYELEFISYLIKAVRNEMFEKLDKQIETFKYFAERGL